MSRQPGLSKSRITLFEQCPKRLWLSVHRPELAEEGEKLRSAFADGHRVGDLACAQYPDGVMVDGSAGMVAALARTRELMASGWDRPIFEGTFAHDGVLARVDLMLPVDDGWHVAEVKNTTALKDYHVGDIATQLWVIRENDVPVRSAAIRHLDRTFILSAEGDYQGLFADTPVDELVEPIIADRPAIVSAARSVLAGDEPDQLPGPHCDAPFTCTFKAWCGRHLPPPPRWPVSILPDASGKKVAAQLTQKGIDDLMAAPADAMPNARLARIREVTLDDAPYHDRDAIRAETASWHYPQIFLDFETIQFPIPRWVGTRPFEQVPFQFSAHVRDEHGELKHHAFLSLDGADPRRACAEALVALPAPRLEHGLRTRMPSGACSQLSGPGASAGQAGRPARRSAPDRAPALLSSRHARQLVDQGGAADAGRRGL